MTTENHNWQTGREPPLIRPHSLAKHRILRAYLERYVSVLTANPKLDTLRLTLVDGFAGGGRYLDSRTREDRPGSPLIMLQAMKAAEAAAQRARSKPFHLDVQYIFIEKKAEALEYLRAVLIDSEFRDLMARNIQLIQDDFVSQVPAIIDFVQERGRAGRTIFSLDQFGYTDVPLSAIGQILRQLANAEVILTFATDFLIDYLSNSEQTQQILERTGIQLPPRTIATAKEERDWRRTIQFTLHREIPERTGAKFYTPFFIRSADSHRDFWLIHLSGHYRARDVMVGLHWQENKSFAHYGRSGLRMLGYDQKVDEAWTKQRHLPCFCFDETARAASHEELLEQLPRRLADQTKGISFADLFSALSNETPVTSEIMKDVLADLAEQGTITIKDKSGALKRSRKVGHASDIVIPSRQLILFPKKELR